MSSTLPISIIRGQSKVVDVYLRDENGVPIDLTGLTELVAELPAANGGPNTSISFTGTEIVLVGSAVLGHVQLQWSAVKTALLKLTAFSSIQPNYTKLKLSITKGTDPEFSPAIKIVDAAHNVVDPIVLPS